MVASQSAFAAQRGFGATSPLQLQLHNELSLALGDGDYGFAAGVEIEPVGLDPVAEDHAVLRHQRAHMQRSAPSSDSLTKRALRGVLRLVFRLSITGDPASFHNERTLIVANHESFLDGLLLALFLPVRATFVAPWMTKLHQRRALAWS